MSLCKLVLYTNNMERYLRNFTKCSFAWLFNSTNSDKKAQIFRKTI